MPDSFGQWSRDLRQRLRRITKRDGEPELPYLPSHTLVPLTAHPGSTAPGAGATAHSTLFTLLPPETRREILVAAFGGRTLHMNLRLGPPLLPLLKRPPVPTTLPYMPHGGVGADLEQGQWPEEVLHAARRARVTAPGTKPVWQWWGCECHRNLPPGDERVVIAPWQDRCVRGEAKWCDRYPGEAPRKCLIGCLGWLMTCRQAYEEGIKVLYGTNTMFLASRKLIDTLLLSASSDSPVRQRVLVLPHRLTLITKLELVWDWALFIRPEDVEQQTVHRADMARSLGLLPRAFPNLVTLFISYSDVLYRRPISPNTYLDEIDHELLLPLSDMLREFSGLCQCVVELPTCIFRPLLSRAQRSGNEVDKGRSWQDARFWWEPDRDIGEKRVAGTDETLKPSGESQPEQKHRVKSRAGFWVKSGVESDLFFDYTGQPKYSSTEGQVLF